LDPTAAAYLQLVYILASTAEPVVIGLCKQQLQQQQLEALIEVWVVIILEERSMAAAAAPPFFSGFDMALLLGVLASILASNSLHLSYLFVSGNPDYNKLVRRC